MIFIKLAKIKFASFSFVNLYKRGYGHEEIGQDEACTIKYHEIVEKGK